MESLRAETSTSRAVPVRATKSLPGRGLTAARPHGYRLSIWTRLGAVRAGRRPWVRPLSRPGAASEGELNDASSSRRLLALSDQCPLTVRSSGSKQKASSSKGEDSPTAGAVATRQVSACLGAWGGPASSAWPVSNRCTPFARFHWFWGTNRNPKWYPARLVVCGRHARSSGMTSLVTLAGKAWEC